MRKRTMGSNSFERPSQETIKEFQSLKVCDIFDAVKYGLGLSLNMVNIRPMFDFMLGKNYVGSAITARAIPALETPMSYQKKFEETGVSSLDPLLMAIDEAQPGDIMVVDSGKRLDLGVWGYNLTLLSAKRKIQAAVIDGGVRDIAKIREVSFPVFASSISIQGTGSILRFVQYNIPIQCGNVPIEPGDIVAGDDDGVVVVPKQRIDEILRLATQRRTREENTREAIKRGRSAIESYPAGRPAILDGLRKKTDDQFSTR